MLRKSDLKSVFVYLAENLGTQAGQAKDEWEGAGDTKYWGTWDDNGYFSAAHPLREEAIERHFSDPAQASAGRPVFRRPVAHPGYVGRRGI